MNTNKPLSELRAEHAQACLSLDLIDEFSKTEPDPWELVSMDRTRQRLERALRVLEKRIRSRKQRKLS